MSILHITNGDIVAAKLRAVVGGAIAVTADVLHEGPAGLMFGEDWRAQRAAHLAAAGYATLAEARRTLDRWDAAIASAAAYDEVVLWFEHDLFDQLLLVRTLDLLSTTRCAIRPPRISLVCINAYLGLLDGAQLQALAPTRAPVTDAQYALAGRVWDAFRQPDPSTLLDARRQLESAREAALPLPFLGDALERFFEEFPSTTNGLSRTADTVLQVLRESSHDAAAPTGAQLFERTQSRESCVFLGDTSLFHIVRRMVQARVPLIAVSGRGTSSGAVRNGANQDARAAVDDAAVQRFDITDAGRTVLECRDDAIRLNGIDEWRGGVQLSGPEPPWRWDPARKTLVSCR